jgi:riboflavin synthase
LFTGLIEDIGRVQELRSSAASMQLHVVTKLPMDEISLGDSIAVNGICLTVVRRGSGVFVADVSRETLNCSNLQGVAPGTEVNLERALKLSDRLGGHLVGGHVDAVAVVVYKRRDGNAIRFKFQLNAELLRYVVAKGSVTIDGVSLTVNDVAKDNFSVAIIPHSLEQTTLKNLRVGDKVNIETDMVARYVEKLMHFPPVSAASEGLTLNHLIQNGFV